jgi:hypothetical protein
MADREVATDREQGFYWVLSNGGWIVAELGVSDYWTVTGAAAEYVNNDFLDIGPKIEPPDSPCRTVLLSIVRNDET